MSSFPSSEPFEGAIYTSARGRSGRRYKAERVSATYWRLWPLRPSGTTEVNTAGGVKSLLRTEGELRDPTRWTLANPSDAPASMVAPE